MSFIHLRVHSAYSLAEGAVKVKDLAKLCLKHEMPAVAITDTVNLFGALEFSEACSGAGIQPIIGALVHIEQPRPDHHHKGTLLAPDHLVLYAQNEQGYLNLMKIVSDSYLLNQMGSQPQITFDYLMSHNKGLIALTAGINGAIGRHLLQGQYDHAVTELNKLKSIFADRLYIEIMRHGLGDEEKIEPQLLELAYAHNVPIVATNDVYYGAPEMYEAHDALMCISAGTYVTESNRRRLTPHHYFKSAPAMEALFADLPEAIENTVVIAKRCYFRSPVRKPILPSYPTTAGHDESQELRLKAEAGLAKRLEEQVFFYTPVPNDAEKEKIRQKYFDRLNYEIGIIEKMGFPGYFLIVSDFIQWAKSQSIPVGPGRGSGAGSLVAWSLTITDIDPIRFTLIFERFLNPERVSMPDFDIDFCQDRRDEVIHYVRDKYGDDRVAHIITFGKLQARAVLRDVGRVLQMPYGQVDKICKLVPNNPANPTTLEQALTIEPALESARRSDATVERLIDIGMKLEGLYRHASTHAAGVVIGDRPLTELVSLYKDDRSELPATQFNMKYVEMAGLVKFDFLGLKTLTVIEKCCQMVRRRGIDIDMSKIPLDDLKTFELLCRVETVGVFQVESAGMRDVIKRLRPDRFEDLVALVALYRPGPMDDIPRYLACKHGEEPVTYLHPELEPILEATYGVMVYQEQVMQIAQVLGGYTLGAADLLRRAMGKKIKSEMDAQQALFVKGAVERDVAEDVAVQIFEQMAKFAGYGFNKSHSAPYSLLTYQTAYLKANYPREFYAASMTYDLQNTDKLNVFRQDMERTGVKLYRPDINHSEVYFKVEDDGVRYALAAIKNVGEQAMASIVTEREKNGPFKDVTDFIYRLDSKAINKRQLENLIAGGAFDSLTDNRRQLYEGIEDLLRFAHAQHEERQSKQVSLFAATTAIKRQDLNLPTTKDWAPLDRLQKEFEALGFFLSAHPLDIYGKSLDKLGIIRSIGLSDCQDGSNIRVAGVLLAKQERTSKTGQKFAFLQISDSNGVYEVAVFSEVFIKSRDLLNAGATLLINAIIRFDGDDFRLTAQGVELLDKVTQEQANEIRIVATSSLATSDLISTIKELPQGNSRLHLELTFANGYRVIFQNLRQAALSQNSRSQLMGLTGVTKIESM